MNRKYKRWVGLGNLDFIKLINVAIRNKMKIICADKPSFHFWYEIGLFGTKESMKKTDSMWAKNKHRIRNRRPRGGFKIYLSNTERSRWITKIIKPVNLE